MLQAACFTHCHITECNTSQMLTRLTQLLGTRHTHLNERQTQLGIKAYTPCVTHSENRVITHTRCAQLHALNAHTAWSYCQFPSPPSSHPCSHPDPTCKLHVQLHHTYHLNLRRATTKMHMPHLSHTCTFSTSQAPFQLHMHHIKALRAPLQPHTIILTTIIPLNIEQEGHSKDAHIVLFSNRGDALLTGSKDGTVRVSLEGSVMCEF